MFGAIASTLGAIAGVAAPLINAQSVSRTNDRQERTAWDMAHFEKEQADTAHQREVADLRAAGLNPYLTTTGNGAPVASGSAPQLQAPQISLPDIFAWGTSLKQLQQADERIDIDKAKLAIDALNSEAERKYKGVKTFNEGYGVNNAIGRFMKSLYNEKGESLNLNQLIKAIKQLTTQEVRQTPRLQPTEQPSSMIGVP